MTDGPTNQPLDPQGWADNLERRLALAEEQFERLGSLGSRQRELIEEGDAVSLLDLLRERQSVLTRIGETSEGIEPFRARWADVSNRLDPDRRQLIQARLDSLTDAASRIAARDQEDRRALESKRDALARELSGVDSAQAAVSAYATPKSSRPRFQDREV